MSSSTSRVERRIRRSGILVLVGLAIEVATLAKPHPLTFMAFTTLGLLVIAAGMIAFLLTLLKVGPGE